MKYFCKIYLKATMLCTNTFNITDLFDYKHNPSSIYLYPFMRSNFAGMGRCTDPEVDFQAAYFREKKQDNELVVVAP
jgi:hypothetical protein